MNERSSQHILCAVRGRPRSRDTATQAINLALETGARLTFVLVIDAEFMGTAAPTLTPLRAVYRQLEEMGEFALLILCDRARRRGVAQVASLIRKGKVRNELLNLILETDVGVLVLGKPSGQPGRDVFTLSEYADFIAELEQTVGIEVVQVAYKPGTS